MPDDASSSSTPSELSERVVRSWLRLSPDAGCEASHSPLASCRVAGNGRFQAPAGRIEGVFAGGVEHRLTLRLPAPLVVNGVTSRLRIEGWDSIRYLAFGYSCEGRYRHVKVPNPAVSRWFDVTLAHGDVAFGLQNDWEHPAATPIGDVRIEVRGTPSAAGGRLEVGGLLCWEEESADPADPAARRRACTRPRILPARVAVPAGWHEAIFANLAKALRDAEAQSEDFMASGLCPFMGGSRLPWPPDAALPSDLDAVNTHLFSWHALHPAAILFMRARQRGDDAAVYAAREMVTQWLDRSYFTSAPEKGYAWYDHGVADRLVALLLAWSEGVDRGFDHRFMTRIGEAIVRHAQLLESECFYAANQGIRHHNHACIQDLALLAAAAALRGFPSAARWRDRACERLVEQMDALAVRDGGYAVCVENSSHYHHGLRGIMRCCGVLARLAGAASSACEFADELAAFSRLLRYPDGRSPANGDSNRSPAMEREPSPRTEATDQPAFVALPKAGYGVVRGAHDGLPYVLCTFGTSICRTHKHQDDLSFTLFFDGIEWLIDPSYFSYEIAQPLPAYLRSVAAHNAIHVPGLAYSIDPGLVRLQGSSDADAFRLDGVHHCYPGTVVTRSIEGRTSGLELRFTDEVRGAEGIPEASLMLHCREGVVATREGARVVLTHPWSRHALELRMPSDRISVAVGEESETRIRGVAGRGFLQKSAIATIECVVPVGEPLRWSIHAVLASRGSGEEVAQGSSAEVVRARSARDERS